MNLRFGILLPLFLLGGVAALAWCFGGFFNETNVCTHCGATRHVRRVLWIPFSETRQTPLSLYQRSHEGAVPLPHQWLFVGGSGGPIRCALGRGRELIRATRSNESVDALKAISKHRGEAEAEMWKDRLLDPKTSRDAHLALYALCGDFDPQDDFDTHFDMVMEEFQTLQDSH